MGTLQKLRLYEKLSVITIKNNIDEIEKSMDSEIITLCKSLYFDKYFYVLKYIIKKEINTIEDFLKICKSEVNENKYKIFDGLEFRHDKDDANFNRGKSFRGKKRPDHSKKLKGKSNIKNKKENWSDERKSYNSFFNSIDWKRKVLTDKGYFLDNVSNESIVKLYSDFRKKIVCSDGYKITKIKNFLTKKKYQDYYDDESFKKILNVNLDEAYRIANSIIGSYHTVLNTNTMGNPIFKRKTFFVNDFLKCKNFENFTVRSSLEAKFIEEIIKPNEEIIEGWSYEKISLNLGSRIYIPDFKITINGEDYLIELKGYIRDEHDFDKILECSTLVSRFYNYVFLTNLENLKINDFENLKTMEIYQKTHNIETIEPDKGISLGLTRDDIVKNLSPKSYFINNGLFFYTVEPDWKEVMFYLLINDKCISEIRYSIENSRIEEENSFSGRFSEKLKENLNKHLDQLDYIKNKNKIC